ncbi:cupin domain-containing protein [Rathayibacter soli]|uniref:cupin domain-containing protein n=1 Tax=Rathayibacter soli TaxID=3144168 RepID=UPI0027E51660|nr:cupin domain-containing protein [Glaciibacter superstes]
MKKTALAAAAREQLRAATDSTSGRAARTIYGGHDQRLRQTVIALTAGSTLAEHRSPGEASIQVIVGKVLLETATASWQLQAGDFLDLPADPHSVSATSDAAILLTVSNAA